MSISGVVIYGCILSCADTNSHDDDDILCKKYQCAYILWQGRNKYFIAFLLLCMLCISVLIYILLEEWYWTIPLYVIVIMIVMTLGIVIKCKCFKRNDNNNTATTNTVPIDNLNNRNAPSKLRFDYNMNGTELGTVQHVEHSGGGNNNTIYIENKFSSKKDQKKSSVYKVQSKRHNDEGSSVHTLVFAGNTSDDSTGNGETSLSLQQNTGNTSKVTLKNASGNNKEGISAENLRTKALQVWDSANNTYEDAKAGLMKPNYDVYAKEDITTQNDESAADKARIGEHLTSTVNSVVNSVGKGVSKVQSLIKKPSKKELQDIPLLLYVKNSDGLLDDLIPNPVHYPV